MKLTKNMARQIRQIDNRRVLVRWAKRAYYHVAHPSTFWEPLGMVPLCGRKELGLAWSDYTGGKANICKACWILSLQQKLEPGIAQEEQRHDGAATVLADPLE